MFQIRREPTESIIELLDKVTLGTDGAHYRHLDTRAKILEADSPLYYTLERNEKAIGNITLCERGSDWYLRYFAFDPLMQSTGKKRSKGGSGSRLKNEVKSFFDQLFKGEFSAQPAHSIYAYIDPKNQKSLWMSESFGFSKVRSIATQSFSRVSPKTSDRVVKNLKWEEVSELVKENFKDHSYFYPVQVQKGPFYGLRNEKGELIAFLKVTTAEWEIRRLPGKLGGLLVRMLPFIPLLNKLIRPAHHKFLVPDSVWVKNNDPRLLSELFEGVLAEEKQTLMLWWIDIKDPFYLKVKDNVTWGVIHKVIGVNEVDLVVKADQNELNKLKSKVHFVSGYDFV